MATFAKEAVFCLQPGRLPEELAIHRMASTELDRKLAMETDIQRPCIFCCNESERNQTPGATGTLVWACSFCPYTHALFSKVPFIQTLRKRLVREALSYFQDLCWLFLLDWNACGRSRQLSGLQDLRG